MLYFQNNNKCTLISQGFDFVPLCNNAYLDDKIHKDFNKS